MFPAVISVAHSCDNLLTNTSGLVRSPAPYVNPGHESGFPCMTTILAAENHVIQLKFTKLDFGCDHGRLEVIVYIHTHINKTQNVSNDTIYTENHVVLYTYKLINDR